MISDLNMIDHYYNFFDSDSNFKISNSKHNIAIYRYVDAKQRFKTSSSSGTMKEKEKMSRSL